MTTLLNVGILLGLIVGSIGFIGNGIVESRHGHGPPVLRWMRNVGLIVVWPLIILRAFVV